jgi:hypothetical protein
MKTSCEVARAANPNLGKHGRRSVDNNLALSVSAIGPGVSRAGATHQLGALAALSTGFTLFEASVHHQHSLSGNSGLLLIVRLSLQYLSARVQGKTR